MTPRSAKWVVIGAGVALVVIIALVLWLLVGCINRIGSNAP